MSGDSTPVKRRNSEDTSYSCESPLSQDALSSPPASPYSGFSYSFNYWDKAAREAATQKKLKLDDPAPFKIASIRPHQRYVGETLVCRILTVRLHPTKTDPTKSILVMRAMDDTGEIMVVAFHPESDKFKDLPKANLVMELTNFRTRKPWQKFGFVTGHEAEILITADTVMTPSEQIVKEIPFTFTKPFSALQTKEPGDLVDVLGVIAWNWGLSENQFGPCRKLTLTDCDTCVGVTLYRTEAETIGDKRNVVVALKDFKLQEITEGSDKVKALAQSPSSLVLLDYASPEKDNLITKFEMRLAAETNENASQNESFEDTGGF